LSNGGKRTKVKGELEMPDKKLIYLDHSATTPVDKDVAELVHETMIKNWGNPSSRYSVANDAKLVLEKAREQVAALINADPLNVFFTSGGTESDNLAVLGVMQKAKELEGKDHFITSAFEHSAVLNTAEYLKNNGFRVTILPINKNGMIETAAVESAIEQKTALVSIMHVNNEIGTIQPINEIAQLCRSNDVLFHTDAVQSFGKEKIDVKNTPIDIVSMSSHKIYGPKGIGAIYVNENVKLEPRALGGGQEKGVRTGTENMPGIAGLGYAAEICNNRFEEDREVIGSLRDKFYSMIHEEVKDGIHLNGSMENRLYVNLNMRFDDVEAESLLLALDLDGICVSTGSACSSGSTKPSHVLLALGLKEQEAHSSIRFTLGRSNTEDDLRYVAERIGVHVKRLREMASW